MPLSSPDLSDRLHLFEKKREQFSFLLISGREVVFTKLPVILLHYGYG